MFCRLVRHTILVVAVLNKHQTPNSKRSYVHFRFPQHHGLIARFRRELGHHRKWIGSSLERSCKSLGKKVVLRNNHEIESSAEKRNDATLACKERFHSINSPATFFSWDAWMESSSFMFTDLGRRALLFSSCFIVLCQWSSHFDCCWNRINEFCLGSSYIISCAVGESWQSQIGDRWGRRPFHSRCYSGLIRGAIR